MSRPTIRIRHQSRFRPIGSGTFHVMFQITAAPIEQRRPRPALDLAFVVDRSGSMSGGPFELARQGVEHALRLLDERDSVSVIVYDDRIDTLLGQRLLDDNAHDAAIRRLRRVQPRGSTDLAGGWLTGCDQLAPIADGSRVMRADSGRSLVRALLLTDGLANIGMTNHDEIAFHAGELAARGISTSTFGAGARYDEDLLARMADAGRGHFHHIPDAAAIPQVFAGELGEMLEVSMREAMLWLRFPTGWSASLMNDLPIERHDGWTVLPLGELSARERRTLLWEFDLPASDDGRQDEIEIRLTWNDASDDHPCTETMVHSIETQRYPGPLDREVGDELVALLGARARDEAVRYHKIGDFQQASAIAREAAMAMPQTEAGQAAARELLSDLAETVGGVAHPEDIKRHYAHSRNVRLSRKDYSKQR